MCLDVQLGCGGNLVQNAVQFSNATAGGGAYINDVPDLSLWGNEWTNNTASVGAAAVDLQSVSNVTIANDTYTGYPSSPLPSPLPQGLSTPAIFSVPATFPSRLSKHHICFAHDKSAS